MIVVDKILLENYKTKEAEKLLTNLLDEKSHSLIVLGKNEENKEKLKNAFRNLPYIKITDSQSLNLFQALPSTHLIFTNSALLETEKRLNYLH